MTAGEIGQLVSQYGFPIVMCAALFWYLTRQDQRYDDQLKAVTNAYNELRLAITKLTAVLGGDSHGRAS